MSIKSLIVIPQQWPEHQKIVIIDGRYRGMVEVYNYPKDKETWIGGLYVNEVHREQGIARRLLNEAEIHAKYLPIHIGVDRFAPQWLKDRYKDRGYIVHIEDIEIPSDEEDNVQ